MTEETENTEIEETPEAEEPGPRSRRPKLVAEPAADVEEPAAEADPEPEESPVEEPVADEPADEAGGGPADGRRGRGGPAARRRGARRRAPRRRPSPNPRRSASAFLARSVRRRRDRKRVPATERKPITRLEKPEHARGRRQERQGTVVSAASDKTIVVRVDVVKVHPRYKKVIKRSTRLHAHDEENQAKLGDVVRVVETRPLSRMKRWRLQEIVEAAK